MLGNIKGIRKSEQGFSLVELNVSIILLGIVALVTIGIFGNYFTLLNRNSTALSMSVDAQSLLRIVSEELRYGAGVRITNSVTDPNGPAGGWNTSNDSFVIITALPATDASNQYIIDPNTGDPYLNELVYYKEDDTMYKRTLANTAATGNTFRTTCPESVASASCPPDIELISNVDTMNFELFDQDNGTTNDPLLARSVVINLNMEKDTFGDPIALTNSVRTTLRNDF